MDTYIFVIGGMGYDTVEMFSICSNSWLSAPSLNTDRYDHSSCALGDIVYTFGGHSIQKNQLLYSIESLNAKNFLASEEE